jgi:hypothetical protein
LPKIQDILIKTFFVYHKRAVNINPSGFVIRPWFIDGVDRNGVKNNRKKCNNDCDHTAQERIFDQ